MSGWASVLPVGLIVVGWMAAGRVVAQEPLAPDGPIPVVSAPPLPAPTPTATPVPRLLSISTLGEMLLLDEADVPAGLRRERLPDRITSEVSIAAARFTLGPGPDEPPPTLRIEHEIMVRHGQPATSVHLEAAVRGLRNAYRGPAPSPAQVDAPQNLATPAIGEEARAFQTNANLAPGLANLTVVAFRRARVVNTLAVDGRGPTAVNLALQLAALADERILAAGLAP
jgi:hypothetical protein